jgi:hypothetical protein
MVNTPVFMCRCSRTLLLFTLPYTADAAAPLYALPDVYTTLVLVDAGWGRGHRANTPLHLDL